MKPRLFSMRWTLGGGLLTLLTVPASALTLPNVPLGITTAAKPMTLLVAGRDHKLFYEAYNDASDIDGDGTLDFRFKPGISYYGLFDSKLCYTYGGSGNSGLFSPTSSTGEGKCTGANEWSGNWLNYVTTSRIDALRKVLYGGYREVDDPDKTILRRAYIPQDAHSWAKEYTSESVDGYRISDYTPLNEPSSGKRHFFGNLTANASTNCATLSNCSNLPPLLSVVINSSKRVWEWASKERPVLDNSHGGQRRNDYTVRVEVCTDRFHDGCKQYSNGKYKPVGLLHDYGESEAMLFGLLTGSYNKNMSGGVLRKVVSSFKDEVNPTTGQFTDNNKIISTFDSLRIRDYNNGRTDSAYRGGWVATRPMSEGEFIDWGNPVAEMMYEALRYFAGKKSATAAFSTSGSYDGEIGLSAATWDDPYAGDSAAKAPWCAKPNLLTISDINPSFDSDQVPGSAFASFSGDLTGLNVASEAATITSHETDVTGMHFIGESSGNYDSAPTAKNVGSLSTIRGLAPDEPTKQGSYYSASLAYFGKRNDLRTDLSDGGAKQSTDTYTIVLASPLPRIEAKLPNGKIITLVPFAKSVGDYGISHQKGQFQPTDQIVDFYVDTVTNSGAADADSSVNGGRYKAKFRINYEDVEQGADHDMDAIAEYEIEALADNTLQVKVRPTYQAGSIKQNMGYIISGSTQDGVYLVAQDENVAIPYFLNVPPNHGAGYCDTATPPRDCNTLPYIGKESQRVFSPGSSAATLLKDPLWYAAKWGGFVDKNNNGKPDLSYEWDADNNGVPDTYFLVQNPLKLKETLKRTFDTIIERSASASNITSSSTAITTETQVFQSIFNSTAWSGNLLAFPITKDGVGATPNWQASDHIPAPASRNIFTFSGRAAKAFQWSQLSSTDQAYLGNNDVLDYIRGVRAKELQNGGSFRNRASTNVLADIVHSSPYYVKDTDTMYVGANDGMLHAFDAKTGQELFAYIPSAVIPRLKDLTQATYTHEYFVDGDIAVSAQAQTSGKNYLVAALGHGGKGLFGLDVTTPASFGTGGVLWEYFDAGDPDLGYLLGRPVIAKLNDGSWAVIAGNGYNSNDGKAVLYIFDLATGALIKKIDTQAGGDNGLASPGVFDSDNDGDVDFIYAGDLQGNVWKFDVTGNNSSQWKVALSSKSAPQPLFTAKDSSGNTQPITAPISVAVDDLTTDPNYGKRFVFFGTGSYFRAGDPSDTKTQSWYSLIDEESQISGRGDLAQRTILAEGTFDGKPVRTFSEASANDMKDKKGWVLDFTTQGGERIVTASKLVKAAEPTLIASSIIPIVDPCVPGGKGFVNALNPYTGTRLLQGFFDVNDNRSFSDDTLNGVFIGGLDLGVGMPSEPVLVGNRLVAGGSSGEKEDVAVNLGAPPLRGRISWREIVVE